MFEGTTAADILKLNRKYNQDYPLLNSIRNEFKDSASRISKDGITLLLDLIEFNAKKRISASQALTHSYFIPAPTGMQKIVGSNEFVVDALTSFDQGEIYSPCSPLKLNPLAQEQVYSPLTPLTPLTPLRLDAFEQASPLLPSKRDRFVKEDSLYLDLGRPEMNGRIDTITSGSTNNSLLLANRIDSSSNIGATTTPSAFGKKNTARLNNKGYKSHNQGANQSFLKAAIFRTMQKNNSENFREEDSFKNRLQRLQIDKRTSDDSPTDNLEQEDQLKATYSHSPEKEGESQPDEPQEHVGDENVEIPQSNMNTDKINLYATNKYPPQKSGTSKMKRFHPFAPGNLIIPKNEISSNNF